MNAVNFAQMTMSQLVEFYNRNSEAQIKRFSDRKTGERRCADLFKSIVKNEEVEKPVAVERKRMQDSLKLDRRITCLSTGGMWDNAHQMWKERPDWMTSGQQDRLTAQLYAAAKEGRKIVVEVNGRQFELLNVGGKK